MDSRSLQRVCVGPAGANQPRVSAGLSTPVSLDNVTNLSKVCRLCTTITDLVIPIFFGEGEQNKLADKIHQHLPIKVAKTDVLPTVVCCQCASTLLAWHELVKCSVQAEQALKAKISVMQQTTKKDVKPMLATNFPQPSSSTEEDSRSKAKSGTGSAPALCSPPSALPLQRVAPYMPHPNSPFRQCEYCKKTLPKDRYHKHIKDYHFERVWQCPLCQEYVNRKKYSLHSNEHGAAAQAIIQMSCQYCRPFLKKENNINQNNNIVTKTEPMTVTAVPPAAAVTVAAIPQAAPAAPAALETVAAVPPAALATAAAKPKTADAYSERAAANPQTAAAKSTKRARQENDFSDHSVDGFGPLPNSVFDAIEDMQDSLPADSDQAPANDTSEEPEESITPTEDRHSTRYHKKSRTCPICSKVYTASSSFFYHMKHTHKRIKEHECEICSKLFATRASLTSHMATHSDERRFECKKCNKRFRSHASLYIHEQIHNGVKTWSCSQCKSSFRWKTHLYRHIQRHAGEKRHICSTCGRGFSVRCDLLRHARTHQGEHFSCDKCKVKFAQQRYLKVHMKKKHGQKVGKKTNSTN